jgi:SAM-dependent methyltransferase
MPGGLDTEVARLRDQALLWWPGEFRALEWFGLRDGMSVLELGSGPGFITEQLLLRFPNSKVTAVERDSGLVEQAMKYLGERFPNRLDIVLASVMETGLPENSFDFAFARFLFQHLPDTVGAARETLRVLKPGGKLVINDPDERLHLWDPPARPEIDAIGEKFIDAHAAKGGNRFIGRRLPRILRDAGFVDLQLESIVHHSDILGIDVLFPKQEPGHLEEAVAAGIITEHDRNLLEADSEEFYASDPIVLLTIFSAAGTKP